MAETRSVVVDGVQFTVLRGTVGAMLDGEAIALGGAQQRKLLAALLAEHDTVVSADRLAESIWPEGAAPDGARRTVMSYVSRLRGTIGDEYLVTRDNGYELALDGAHYDATDFELALAAAPRQSARCRSRRVRRGARGSGRGARSVTTPTSGGCGRSRRGSKSCGSSRSRNAPSISSTVVGMLMRSPIWTGSSPSNRCGNASSSC